MSTFNPIIKVMISIFAALFIITSILLLSRMPLNYDVSWILCAGDRIYNNAKLYIDIFEVNPPLAVYFNMPVIYLTQLLNLSVITIFYIYTISYIIITFIICFYLSKLASKKVNSLIFVLMINPLLFILLLLPGISFGQREHIMIILTIPYIFSACIRALNVSLNTSIAFIIGILAGVGLSFKPYFLILWFFVEAYLCYQFKTWKILLRWENYGIIFAMALYGLIIYMFFYSYLSFIPFINKVYFIFNTTLWDIIISKKAIIVYLSILLFIIFNFNNKEIAILRILILASIGVFLSAIIQMKGWPNHMYPSLSISFLIISFVFFAKILNMKYSRRLVAMLSLLFFVGLFSIGTWENLRIYLPYVNGPGPKIISLAKQYAYKKPIYTLTTAFGPAFDLVIYSGAQWPYHFPSLWPLPGFYYDQRYSKKVIYHSINKMIPEEKFVFETVISDLISNPPTLFVIDRSKFTYNFTKVNFDFLEYFSMSNIFVTFFQSYKYLATIGDYDFYIK